MKKRHSVKPQDRPQTKLRVQSRRARVLQLFKDGKSTREASRILKQEGFPKASQSTVSVDLRALQADFAEIIPRERVVAFNELKELGALLKQEVRRSRRLRPGEAIKLSLETHDRLARLVGLDAPTKSLSAKVDATLDPEKLSGYRRFVSETQLLSESQLEQVYEYARSLKAAPAPINLSLKGGAGEAD